MEKKKAKINVKKNPETMTSLKNKNKKQQSAKGEKKKVQYDTK